MVIRGQLVISRTWLCQLPRLTFFLILCGLAVFLSYKFPITIVQGELFKIGSARFMLSLPLFTLIPLSQLAYMAWYMYDALYIIDNRGVEMNIGILSARQKRVKVRFEDIRSIEVDQSILERILDVGHVLVSSAASSDVEIFIDYISNPRELQDLIQSERDKRVKFKPNDTDTREHALFSD